MDNHFEVMWDTFRDVPSIETRGRIRVWMNITGSTSMILTIPFAAQP